MWTAARIALMLTGTAILVAAMATPGALAGRGPDDDSQAGVLPLMTASQRARLQALPDRIDYVRAGNVVGIATAIARASAAPQDASAGRSGELMNMQPAIAARIGETKNRSLAWANGCDRATFAAQEINASDGGRGAPVGLGAEILDDPARCRGEKPGKRRTRQALLGTMEQLPIEPVQPSPVVIKFEAVISINLAALGW